MVKSFIIKLHSSVDVITNSSTVIYTYQDSCVQPAKDMIQAFMEAFGVDGKVEDCFTITSIPDFDRVFDKISDDYWGEACVSCGEDPEVSAWKSEKVSPWLTKVLSGEIEKPEWWEDRITTDYYGDPLPNSLVITPKSEEYTELSQKIVEFLNSAYHEAEYDG